MLQLLIQLMKISIRSKYEIINRKGYLKYVIREVKKQRVESYYFEIYFIHFCVTKLSDNQEITFSKILTTIKCHYYIM